MAFSGFIMALKGCDVGGARRSGVVPGYPGALRCGTY
jgi:hypothetical protein